MTYHACCHPKVHLRDIKRKRGERGEEGKGIVRILKNPPPGGVPPSGWVAWGRPVREFCFWGTGGFAAALAYFWLPFCEAGCVAVI